MRKRRRKVNVRNKKFGKSVKRPVEDVKVLAMEIKVKILAMKVKVSIDY